MKAGIRRMQPTSTQPARAARDMLAALRRALECAHSAGSCYTAARIRQAISSAKGAVRAADYRERRKQCARSA